MKAILTIFIIIAAINLNAQEKKQGVEEIKYIKEIFKKDGNVLYSKHYIIVDSIRMQIGDTVFLSVGTGKNKSFGFASYNLFEDATIKKGMIVESLPANFSNTYFILIGIAPLSILDHKITDGVFVKPGTRLKVLINIEYGLLNGEIKRISGQKIDPSTVQIKK